MKQLPKYKEKSDMIEYVWTGGNQVFHLWKVFVGVKSFYWPDRDVRYHVARMVMKD